MYVNVPAASNRREYVSPLPNRPLSKEPGSELTTSWRRFGLVTFVQRTAAPWAGKSTEEGS
jgi:hypothetical protein